MSLIAKLQKNTKIKQASILTESEFFGDLDVIPTAVPMLNVALSGALDAGILPGILMLAGPSKHFKTCFSLMLAKAYLDKHEDAVILFYDSEFGSPQSYFENFGIDPTKVFHTPITDVEVLKNDIMNQLKNIERGDHIFIIIDSIGNLASKKEVEDAEEGKSVADMTRAKALKSLGRMITSHLTLKNIPLVAINHIYMTMEMFAKPVVSGGTGLYLSAHDVWILGRQQDKNEKTKVIEGYDFIINVDKSRYVKEKTRIPISITYENGIDVKSGLFEQALAGGFIKEASKGWYTIGEEETKKRRDEIEQTSFLLDLCEDDAFKTYIRKKYQTGYTEKKEDE